MCAFLRGTPRGVRAWSAGGAVSRTGTIARAFHEGGGENQRGKGFRQGAGRGVGAKGWVLAGLGVGGVGWAVNQGWTVGWANGCDMRAWVSRGASDVDSHDENVASAAQPCNESAESDKASQNGSPVAHLCLLSGATLFPHPSKIEKGGEDAYFISENKLSIGVADGVGGWALSGVDPGIYARTLMRHAKSAAESEDKPGPQTPKTMLKVAQKNTIELGSSTACVLSLDASASCIHAANLGDSGFIVIRNSKLIFQTSPQLYQFNFPYQLGHDTNVNNKPEEAQELCVAVQPGDVIVAATDGLWDNLFVEECCKVVGKCKQEGRGPEESSRILATHAQVRAFDREAVTPFFLGARAVGFPCMAGGKPDDITVVVSYVSQSSKL